MVNVGKYTSPMDVMGNNNLLPTARMGHRELDHSTGLHFAEVVKLARSLKKHEPEVQGVQIYQFSIGLL